MFLLPTLRPELLPDVPFCHFSRLANELVCTFVLTPTTILAITPCTNLFGYGLSADICRVELK